MATDNKTDMPAGHVSPTTEVRLPPIGFWSYGRQDDELSQGKVSTLRSLLMFELQQQHGRDQIHIFQDARTIQHGAAWEREIRRALLKATFFIPVITPNFVQSDWCCREVILFLEREAELQQLHPDLSRRSRIFPIHFIGIEDVDAADPTALAALQSRQWFDFRKFRHRSYESEEVREAIADLAGSIRDLLKIKTAPAGGAPARPPPPSRPMEDAQEREAAAEAERRRQEAEAEAEAEREAAARRLEAEKQEAEAERQRQEAEAEREAAAEAERRRQEAEAEAEREAAAEAERRRQEAEAEREAAARRLEAEKQEAAAEAERRRREAEAEAESEEAAAEQEREAEWVAPSTEDDVWAPNWTVEEADEEVDGSRRLKRWVAIGLGAFVVILGLVLWLAARPSEPVASRYDPFWLYGRWCELDSAGGATTRAWEFDPNEGAIVVSNSSGRRRETIEDATGIWIRTDNATYDLDGTRLTYRYRGVDTPIRFRRCY